MPGSTGSAYFECLAWTGLFNSYSAAVAGGAYVADTGVFPGVTCPGGISPIPSLQASMPAMILRQVPVPEPSTLLLAAAGLAGLLTYARRNRK